MDEGPEFRHFVSFVAVAETCNFGKAAERLGMAQPTLSLQIKQIEDWAGERLLLRSPSGSSLTEAGRHFLVVARHMIHLKNHARHAIITRRSEWPLRLGFSLFARHDLVEEAIVDYKEIVPGGTVQTSSDCTARLVEMLEDGRLEAAVVTLPIGSTDLVEQRICDDKVLVCLRKDDPMAERESIPKDVVAERLKVMFHRDYHPHLYDKIMARFRGAGMHLHPTETFSAPSDMQHMVKSRGCFGLVREHTPLLPELTSRPISGFSIKFVTAVVSHAAQQRPAIPVMAYRMAQRCADQLNTDALSKKPPQSASNSGSGSQSQAG